MIRDVAQTSPKLHRVFGSNSAKLDYSKEAQLPTTDFGALAIDKAKTFLKWQPRPMSATVQMALEWYFGGRQGYPSSLAAASEEL